jgi:hypothetical protein
MSLNFSQTIFSDPLQITNWSPPPLAGIYAILVYDGNWTPQPYRPIYFGESGNFSERGFLTGHHKFLSWALTAGGANNLFVAISLMPGSTPEQRRLVEAVLIQAHNPVCND